MGSWVNIALKLAQGGVHSKYRHGAIVIQGGSIVSRAHNLGRNTHWGVPNRGRHAEERALQPNKDYTGATLCVVRHDGNMSAPCSSCMDKIRKAGIRKIVYSYWDGSIKTEKV